MDYPTSHRKISFPVPVYDVTMATKISVNTTNITAQIIFVTKHFQENSIHHVFLSQNASNYLQTTDKIRKSNNVKGTV